MKLFILVVVCLAAIAVEAHEPKLVATTTKKPTTTAKTTTKSTARTTTTNKPVTSKITGRPTTTTTSKKTTVKALTSKPTTFKTTTAKRTNTTTKSKTTTNLKTTVKPSSRTTATSSPILIKCYVLDPAPPLPIGGIEACGTMCTNLTSNGGVVQSLNFPGDYGNEDRYCAVNVLVPAGWMIQLKFTTFNLEVNRSTFNVHDYEYELLPYTSGNRIPALVPTSTDRMQILFQSAASKKPTSAVFNWQATFSVTSQGSSCYVIAFHDESACGTMCFNVTSAGSGVVQSSNFPANYGNIENRYSCIVAMIVPAGKKIQLTFTTFNLETGISSIGVSDKIRIYSSDVTGNTIPAVVTTKTNIAYISFTSERRTKPNTTVYNWQATYTAV